MRRIWLLIWFLGLSVHTLSAQDKADSLRMGLMKAQTVEEKVDLQNKLALELKNSQPAEALKLSYKALAEAKENGYTKGAGIAQSNLGLLFYLQNNIDSATYYNKKAIGPLLGSGDSVEISKNYNRLGVNYYVAGNTNLAAENYLQAIHWSNNARLKANAFNNLGMISKHNGDHSQAIFYHAQALSLYELLDDKLFLSRTYSNLGGCYLLRKNYVAAEENYLIAERLGKESNHTESIAQAINGLGVIASKKGALAQAISYFQSSANLYQQLNLPKEYAQQLVNLGDMFTQKSDYATAISYYNQAIAQFEKIKDKQSLAATYNNLGNLYNKKKDNKQAIANFEKAIALAEFSNEKNFKVIIAKNLSSIYEEMGNSEKALAYRKLYDVYKEEVINVAENVKYLEIDKTLEVSKKEKQLAQQNQQLDALESNRTWLIVLLVVSVLLAVFLYGLNQKRIKKQLNLEQNIDSISKQIESLKSENYSLKDKLIQTERELENLNHKYSGSKEKLPESMTSLSKREYEVLLFIAEGLTDKEISEKIFVSINTVRTHTRRIYDKLLVNNRLEAVALLNKYQLIGE
jgi:DNA-binding CsgD family transcriptional regulator